MLFAVNTPAGRLSVFSLANPASPQRVAEIPVGVEPVSVWPESNDIAWVVNHVSGSLSVVSVSQGKVLDTLDAGNEPADVVITGSPRRVLVTAARDNMVRMYDPVSHDWIMNIPLMGEHPRALAVSPDGRYAYTAFALGGNRTTFVPAWENPFVEPEVEGLPVAPHVGRIVDALDPQFADVIRFTLLVNDVAEIDLESFSVRYFERAGTVNFALAVNPANGHIFLANTEADNRTFFLPNLRDRFVSNRVSKINPASGELDIFDLDKPLFDLDDPVERRSMALAQPAALVFESDGDFFWLAAFGSDRVARISSTGELAARVDLRGEGQSMRGPRGLVLHPEGAHLYVLNRVSNTLQVVSISTGQVTDEQSIGSYDPTPVYVQDGRRFLYDARLSGSGTTSCASCHVDAGTDNLAWNLGDPDGEMKYIRDPLTEERFSMHPMKGPMVTQPLSGLKGTGPFHWRGDMPDLMAFNVLFPRLLGGLELPQNDMQRFVDFIESITLLPNPYLRLDGSLPDQVEGYDPTKGLEDFSNPSRCGGCHTRPSEPFEFRMATNGRQHPAKVAIPRHA
jgi:DNA-binding beta-propeller fold protein YncE